MHYTAESIQTMLDTRLLEKRQGWLNKLHENRPDKWWCDQRTEDLFVLTRAKIDNVFFGSSIVRPGHRRMCLRLLLKL